jgi:hypothetical protein
LMMTQTLYLQLEKPRVTIVPQKPRMLRGRFLFLLLLAPILFVTVPTLMPNSFTIGAVVKKIKSLQTYLQGKEKKIEGMQVGGSGTRRLGKNSENL